MASNSPKPKRRTVTFPGDASGNLEAMDRAIVNGLVHHVNVDSELITTTDDRLARHLQDYRDNLVVQHGWATPLGIVLALLATLVTADFRDAYGLAASEWRLVFLACFLGAAAWLVLSLLAWARSRRQGGIRELINRIAKEKP